MQLSINLLVYSESSIILQSICIDLYEEMQSSFSMKQLFGKVIFSQPQ